MRIFQDTLVCYIIWFTEKIFFFVFLKKIVLVIDRSRLKMYFTLFLHVLSATLNIVRGKFLLSLAFC